MVWKFHYSSGFDWDELFAQANLIYCDALSSYDPSKGKFSTWLVFKINQLLICNKKENRSTYISKEELFSEIEINSTTNDPYHMVLFKQTLEKLSSKARHMVNLILDPPKELMDFYEKSILYKEDLYKFLRTCEGWTLLECWRTKNEIKTALANF